MKYILLENIFNKPTNYHFSICRCRLRDRTGMPGRWEVELLLLSSKSSGKSLPFSLFASHIIPDISCQRLVVLLSFTSLLMSYNFWQKSEFHLKTNYSVNENVSVQVRSFKVSWLYIYSWNFILPIITWNFAKLRSMVEI